MARKMPGARLDNPERFRDILLFGDGKPILSDAKARLEELVASFPED